MAIVMSVNAGSSSFKFQVFEMPEEKVLAQGNVERIGLENSIFGMKFDGNKIEEVCDIPDHAVAVQKIMDALVDNHIVNQLEDIQAIGHRMVHGGEYFDHSVLESEDAINKFIELTDLAPLHNPAGLLGYRSFKKALPNASHTFVFDTAFHQTMPSKAFMYALPYEYYNKDRIRKYGFHGTSHKYVSQKAAEFLGKKPEELKIVTCHLGNGSSITAVDGGKCIDTSMGFTPLDGVPMGTRTGSMDPAVVTYLINQKGMSARDVDAMMNKESGVSGISGVSSDFRDLSAAAKEGNERAQLALDMFSYQVKKDSGAYAAAMGGIDAVVFTAGVGENDAETRAAVFDGLEFMGIKIDADKNNTRGTVDISAPDAKVKTLVIPTNEELMIAIDTKRLVEGK